MQSQYNRQSHNKIYPLTERGFRQASRNNSHQIDGHYYLDYDQTFHTNREEADKNTKNLVARKEKSVENQNKQKNEDNEYDHNKDQQSFKITKNEKVNNQQGQNKFKRTLNTHKKPKINKRIIVQEKPVLTKQQTQLQRLKRKSIQKYIKEQVPFTRTLSNSAFKKFYQRPCPQAYGNKNVNSGGVCYGDFMKTHNIQPHTLDNKPQYYQTFTSALNFGKRTKLDLQDRWKKIQRQLAKNLDYRQLVNMRAVGQIQINQSNKQQVLKQNINIYGQENGKRYIEQENKPNKLSKTSKSLDKLAITRDTYRETLKVSSKSAQKQVRQHNKGLSSQRQLYYIYKSKQGNQNYNYTRYARDRHGITCYVDNCFRQNDEAYVNFLKKIKPIYAEKCKPDDMNIDNIRIQNHELNRQEEFPRHYLIPNTEEPYNPKFYSRKKKSSGVQIVI